MAVPECLTNGYLEMQTTSNDQQHINESVVKLVACSSILGISRSPIKYDLMSFTTEQFEDRSLQTLRGGLAWLPAGSELVIDADEEIFLLYTRLAGNQDQTSTPLGLGFIDSKASEITVSFSIDPPSQLLEPRGKEKSSRRHAKRQPHPQTRKAIDFEITLEQDPSSLQSRRGDTGSVLWRACIQLSRLILLQHHFPPSSPSAPLFDPEHFSKARVLELGAGIGLLPCILTPFVGHYTVTDIDALIPLIRKNVAHTLSESNIRRVSTLSLDWVLLHATPPARRVAVFDVDTEGSFDLIICCDCIYNAGLIPALVTSINYCSQPEFTAVLLVVELREEDVLREFLNTWLASGPWDVWRLPQELFDSRTVGWIGQMVPSP
ncbi:hypothetical protein FRB96_002134 [Tulasnella sp. 330]|nr:hypothetical protein FRB96_002134 [Tulasnella sp. 330]